MAGHVILFPGQGAQYIGMAGELCKRNRASAAVFERAASILGYDLLKICVEGPLERLNSTEISQPAIFVSSLAALAEAEINTPDLTDHCVGVAGLSLGEYTALVYSKAISFEDGLRLVALRGKAMQHAADDFPGTMASILLLENEKVQGFCDQSIAPQSVSIANYLCPGNLVVSGSIPAVENVEKLAQGSGGKTIRLSVAGAFHTHFMKPAQSTLSTALTETNIQTPKFPVWSNVTGLRHGTPDEIRELLSRQVIEPVQWESLMLSILALPVDTFYEIGPGKVLSGLLKRINRKATCQAITA